MTIIECARLASALVKEREYHIVKKCYYSRLFNESMPDLDIMLSTGDKVIIYSPIQEFYQHMCQLHRGCEAELDKRIIEFVELPD